MQIAYKMEKVYTSIISYAIFVGTLTIVFINLLSLFFPALLIAVTIGTENRIDPFEIGIWTVQFLVINLVILGFGLLYYKKSLPSKIVNAFRFILNFEVSRKVATIVFISLLSIYVAFTIPELGQKEGDTWKDWEVLGPIIEDFPDGGENLMQLRNLYVNNFLLFSSQTVFQNVKLLPFFASMSLIIVTYLLTAQISQKRFAGLVAVVVLLQSHTFLRYDTTATYSNFWSVFYIVSIYFIYKKWPLAPIAYIASIFSKVLTIAFLPMTVFFIFRTQTSKKTKIYLTSAFLIIFALVLGVLIFGKNFGYDESLTSYEFSDFVSGFTAWAFQLRIDGVVLVFLLPLIIGLFLKSRKGIKDADSIMVMIAGLILSVPLLAGFTEFNIQPYRWIPLITFFAIGVGTLLSKTSANRPEN